MERYRRLSLMEREELSRLLAAGYSLRAAAEGMTRARNTVSCELTRHRTSPVTYRVVPAHLGAAPSPPTRKPRKCDCRPGRSRT